jgi:hypothetical protein
MSVGHAIVAVAVLTMLALPHALVRGKAPRGKTQHYICDRPSCSDRTDRQPEEKNPQRCADHGRPMTVEAYQR